MKLFQPSTWFSTRLYIPESDTHATTLKALAPTVTPEEVAKLERKWKREPVDFERLPV